MRPDELTTYTNLASKCLPATGHLVLPDSLTPKRMCIIGESLGADEVANSSYFCGKAGQLLNKLLSDVGLIRPTIHITNIIKVRPPDNKIDRLSELGGLTVQDFLPYLKEELLQVNPTIILAVGSLAAEVLCGVSGITKWRGSVLSEQVTGKSITTVVTLHPSYLMRGNMDQYVFVRHDMDRFAKLGFGLKDNMVPFNQVLDPTLYECLDYLNDIYHTSTETSLDIETVARQRITCIGFTKDPNNAICIPFRVSGLRNRWTKPEFVMLLDAIRQVLRRPKLAKIGQNLLQYDLHYLQPILGFPREPIWDLLYAHHLLHPDASHTLGFIMSVYSDMPYHKEDAKDWELKNLPHQHALWDYNSKDCIGTHRAMVSLRRDLKEAGLWNMFTGYVMPLRCVLFEMEHTGMRVDMTEREEWTKFVEEEELPMGLAQLEKMCGRTINPNSSPQIGAYLASLGVPVQTTPAGNYTCKEDKMEEYAARFPHLRKLIQAILCVRVLKAKTLGTYLRAKVSADDRLRTSYGITYTARLTSHENHVGEGTNNQNYPKFLRTLCLPELGQVFIEPDLSQAEARWMAYLMRSDKLKSIFKSGQKIHKVMGGEIYNKDPDKLTADEYDRAKKTVHGSNYSIGINKYAVLIQQTVAEAKILREKYFTLVPELQQYHKEVRDGLSLSHFQQTPWGRIRPVPKVLDDEDFRAAYAYIPQSGVVDTLNFGMLSLWLIKPTNVHIKHQGHDSILISIDPKDIEWFAPFIKMHLETLREVVINGETLVVPVEISKPKQTWGGDIYVYSGYDARTQTS